MSLSGRITEVARDAGADLVGFAPIERFDEAPPAFHPTTVFPHTRTVIAVAVRHERGGKEFAHAPFDPRACAKVHRGDDPRFSPFWNGTEREGEQPTYSRFLLHRFRHLGICVGRGCLRACLDHLEKTGRIQRTYRTPFIERERWKLNQPPERKPEP